MDLARYTALFLSDSRDHLQRCNELLLAFERDPGSSTPVAELFRAFHSIKGSSAAMGFEPVSELAHAAEQVLSGVRSGVIEPSRPVIDGLFQAVDTLSEGVEAVGRGETPIVDHGLIEALFRLVPVSDARTAEMPIPERRREARPSVTKPAPGRSAARQVRVDLDRLDALVNDVGELVVARNRLSAIADREIGSELEQVSGRISALVAGLQSGVLRARMAPVEEIFDRFPRMVRDLGRELGKEIHLELQGHEIEVDRSVLDALADPLTHLIRNAADHGLEAPAERHAAGKESQGTIRLRAERVRDEVTVTVADDGAGIDRVQVRDRAVERGLLDAGAPVPDAAALLRLLAHPGFTMKAHVTTVSGRGVGIDAVLTRVRSLGGRMEIKTTPGRGTTFLMHLPVTRAILRALLVGVEDERYAIPFGSLAEAVVHEQTESEVTLRGSPLPTADLREVVGLTRAGGRRPVVVVEAGGGRAALLVDVLLGQQDVVVEQLAAPTGLPAWVGGATILPDGAPALILDPAALF
ncbi:MAG TPA: chemotaxis protein CheA [Gemmatimonadales bacterium]|nr:chemotaxis protein CheA [Gemmatimonadales bacterium]